MDMIKQLSLAGLVPVIAVNDAQDAIPLCKALSDGGLPVAEITFRTSAAEEGWFLSVAYPSGRGAEENGEVDQEIAVNETDKEEGVFLTPSSFYILCVDILFLCNC